jgi:hypothetical protein
MKKKNEAPILNGRLEGKRKLWVAGIGGGIFVIIFLVMIALLIPPKDGYKALETLSKFIISIVGFFVVGNGIEHLSKKSKVINKFFKKGGRSDE